MGEGPQSSGERTLLGRHWNAFVRCLLGLSGTVPAVHRTLFMPRGVSGREQGWWGPAERLVRL